MTKLVAQQPLAYGGWLGSIEKLIDADVFVLYNDVQYVPKSFNNRNKIRTQDGWQWLTVPVLKKGYLDKPFHEIKIDNKQPWKRKHLRTIEHNYARAKCFDDYIDSIISIYDADFISLSHFNLHFLIWVLVQLGIDIKVLKASDYDFQGEKSGKVLDMCQQLGATTYIYGQACADYLDVEAFKKAGIELELREYECKPYQQVYEGFEPSMCMLDLLLNHGRDSLEIIRGK